MSPRRCPPAPLLPLQPGEQEGLGSVAEFMSKNCKLPLAIVHPDFAQPAPPAAPLGAELQQAPQAQQ